ncbi:MAG: twin-arginine translocase TatA/TatE family subunit [Alphaproteobacteria bacterium]|nr:MAG: twin-arginine translocase TatA/TatE family subunit [Alphaproteobacteria bacterium]
MGLSFWQIAIVVLLFVLLFGRGKISDLMGDVAKGIKSFKKGLSDDDVEMAEPEQPKVIDQKSETIVSDKNSKKTNS